MKLSFTFSDTAEAEIIKQGESRHFQFPDAALLLPDCQARILEIANLVGELTQAVLHVTCKELAIKDHPIKLVKSDGAQAVSWCFDHTVLLFQRRFRRHTESVHLKILLPRTSPYSSHYRRSRGKHKKSLSQSVIPPNASINTDEQRLYLDRIHTLADHCLALLNSEPPPDDNYGAWTYIGFHPQWRDNAAITRSNKAAEKALKAAVRRERQEQKRREQDARRATQTAQTIPTTQTGAGRRPGAVPGVFKGVQMRSQLEIRFAAHLEEMGIRWVYEAERLGAGQYLVDFYLPDLKTWVEVKGTFEPRDNFLLKEVAADLKQERGERLFVFTQSKAFSVSSRAFTPLTHKEFWAKIDRSG